MADDRGTQAAGLLVDEAWSAFTAGRYQQAISAAGRAVEAAGELDDPVLLVRALSVEADALRMAGDNTAALARYTRILGLAEDPSSRGRLDHPFAAQSVARAHWSWAGTARMLTGIPVRELFGVLEAAERWVAATGHPDWRAAILLERALTHQRLQELATAVDAAEEALALKTQHPQAPGYTLNAHRFVLGDILRHAGRPGEAAPLYQAILDDPDAVTRDRYAARQGLARCALAAGDPVEAHRQARTAVQLAEPLGDDALCTALEMLTEACRADGDLDAAWQAATRHLEAAGRIGGHVRPFFAVRTAADIALDRADLATARLLLADLDEHARAVDAATGGTTYTDDAAQRHQRLASLGQRR